MKRLTLDDLPGLFTPILDFPEKGIRFWNIEDLTATPGALELVTNLFAGHCRGWERVNLRRIDYIAAFDARGFIFGAALARELGIGLLQIRKLGKLPPLTISESYTKEYSKKGAPPEVLEMTERDLTGKVVVAIDDLLATGGTAAAGCKLIEKLGGTVAAFMAVTDLPALGGRLRLDEYHCFTLMTEIGGELKLRVRYCVDGGMFDTAAKELLLINRLSEPTGVAMVGGGIDGYESPLQAMIRETMEETGCYVTPDDLIPHSVLVGADRDPRGDQVSIVYRIHADTQDAQGEPGKTTIVRHPNKPTALPDKAGFAFGDHHRALSTMLTEPA